eukprot:CAMPEP_0201566046 /NCGR_PEP_ID=MMETSP0190_2-20130828/5562_1 /ASSEMBLY_ACC=CAM_ASM_000263 /TAXON_ID=37353 /ORGANISM="Rosalina sp." /LENGTH=114 /DNA_ID=CAMNT_0047984245 /DNA_START=36 /DNA_END=380 /DNA_ORIENTATION=-
MAAQLTQAVLGAEAIKKLAKSVNEILEEVGKLKNFYPSSYSEHDKEGGKWITGVSDGKVFSIYHHPTKWHKASVIGKVNVNGDWVKPGETAVAIATQKLLGGNKSFYDVKKDEK